MAIFLPSNGWLLTLKRNAASAPPVSAEDVERFGWGLTNPGGTRLLLRKEFDPSPLLAGHPRVKSVEEVWFVTEEDLALFDGRPGGKRVLGPRGAWYWYATLAEAVADLRGIYQPIDVLCELADSEQEETRTHAVAVLEGKPEALASLVRLLSERGHPLADGVRQWGEAPPGLKPVTIRRPAQKTLAGKHDTDEELEQARQFAQTTPCPNCGVFTRGAFRVLKEGDNQGRLFLKCDECQHFQWWEDATTAPADGPVPPEAAQPTLLFTLTHGNFVRAAAITPDGQRAATAAFDDTIRLWDITTGQEVRRWEVAGRNTVVAITPDGACLAGGNADGELIVWDLATGEERWGRQTRQGWAYDLDVSPDGQLLASANHTSTVSLWNRSTGANVCHLKGHEGRVWCVSFSPDDKLLASGAEDGLVILWEVASRRKLHEFRGHKRHVSALAFSPDGRRLASVEVTDTLRERGENRSGGLDDRLIVWDLDSGNPVLRLCAPRMAALAWSPDGDTIVTGDHFGKLHFWDVETGKVSLVFDGQDGAITCVVFSRDGTRLVSSGEDCTARVWGLEVKREEPSQPPRRSPSVPVDPELLQVIQEDTLEDAPRLKAADWLEQQGDTARAELIRLQCELARLAPDDPRRRVVSQHEQELRREHEEEWLAPLLPFLDSCAIKRGFVSYTRIKATKFLAYAEDLYRLAPISSVTLTEGDAHLAELAQCPHLARLMSLHLAKFPSEPPLPLDGLAALFASPHLTRLRSLDLQQGRIGVEGARLLASSGLLARLTALDLSMNGIGLDGLQALMESAADFRPVSLWLKLNSFGDAGVRTLLAALQAEALTTLDLGGNVLTNAAVEALAGSEKLTGLTSLDLLVNQIGDAGAKALASSPHMGNLTFLALGSNQIGEEGARALADSPYFTKLTRLDLASNPVPKKVNAVLKARFGKALKL